MPKKTRLEGMSFSEATTAALRVIRGGRVERLPDYFEQTCDRRPHETAIICGPTWLTYKELDERANRLAHLLISRGVGKGDPVGILLERSLDTYTALLGVLKAGAAFVPLDPLFPPDLVAFIEGDAGLRDLVTTSVFREKTSALSCPVLEIDQQYEALCMQPENRPQVFLDPASLCYIIYTFDTTGRPQGVAVSHANIVDSLRAAAPIYRITRNDRVYQGMSIAFNFSLVEIWPTWIAGATLVAGPTDSQRLGHGLAAFLAKHNITVFCCVPGLLGALECDAPSLRSLIIGGQTCPADLVSRWSRPGRRILNTYGFAETTLTATWCELFPGRPVTISSPVPTYAIYILDGQLRLIEDGGSGEVCISGPGVAIGYLNRPDLTKDRFVPNPVWHDRENVTRLYRTGDFGRVTPSGEIEYLGPIVRQMSTRDHRIGGETEQVVFPSRNLEPLNEYAFKREADTVKLTQLKQISFTKLYKHVMTDPLYRNSLFNMSGTFVLGGLGFVFWIIIARLYNTEQVGIATTLISIVSLLSSLTMLGLGSSLMRHLPKSANKRDLINSSFLIVMLVTLLASVIFLLGLPIFSSQLLFLRSNLFYIISFTLFIISFSWNTLAENTFMAFRSAGNILIKNIIISTLKLVLPFAFIVFGAYGIFASYASALSLGVLAGLITLIFKFKIKPAISVNLSLIKDISRYSFGNYITSFALIMPSLVLPIIILNTLSANYAAYFYVASMIQSILQIIPSAASQALLTEGSYNEVELKKHIKKAMATILVILIPAITIIVFGGAAVLQFFGKNYANQAFQFLRLYSISTVFTALLLIANAIMNVRHHIKTLVIANVIASAFTLGLSCAFISGGLTGIGWGWALGQAIAGLIAILFIIKIFATSSSFIQKGNVYTISRPIQDAQKELRSATKPTVAGFRRVS